MLKKILPMLIVLMLLAPSFCFANGIAPDKQEHIGVAAGLNLAMEEAGVKKETRWTILGGLFVAKEVYDHNKEHPTHSHGGDLVADVAGVVVSEGIIWIVHKTW